MGSAMPGKIGREEPETEMVRQRTPILVRDAQSKRRIHRELITLADTRDYIAAPILAHGTVIAVLHADRHSQSVALDTFDRDLIGAFCEGVGLAFERALYQERFVALKRQFERQANDVDEFLYGTTQWDISSGDERVPQSMPRANSIAYAYVSEGPLHGLTRRELEVLRHVGGGTSNQDIASRLGVSTGTVKTHMKNILRKLDATSRNEAAAIFRNAFGIPTYHTK
jgi:DNA-binding CsgD family transcriptional regulator